MSVNFDKYQNLSDEDAYAICVDFLKQTLDKTIADEFRNRGSFDVSASGIVDHYLNSQGITRHNMQLHVKKPVSQRILTALWQLCLKGVLRPSVLELTGSGGAVDLVPGDGYSITEQGREWLKSGHEFYPLISSQGFLRQLLQFEDRFGQAYRERAKDAVLAYDATAYFACCAMCGAASESIYISLAVARKGDLDEILKTYKASDGRKKIQSLLEANKPSGLIRGLNSGFAILAYWRDMSAHGERSNVGKAEAFSALQTLLALVQFANDRWDDITSCPKSNQTSD